MIKDIVKHELQLNIKELKRCIDEIIPFAETTEEIVKLNFDFIRRLADYCERLSLEGESTIEKWIIPKRLMEEREIRTQQ